jgi:DNA sulfur modification protein DndD
MKLIKAHFKNFRLLKDLELDFSISDDKKLTVIRAANETGKTTCQYGLMWGLFGSKNVLRKDYVLSPKDSITPATTSVEISVEIEFLQKKYTNSRGGITEAEENHYKLKRICTERWRNQNFEERSTEHWSIYKINPSGTSKLSLADAEEVLNEALPVALKDVYFTDGDSALAFIEAGATQGVKRGRVSKAVESLLGLEVLRQTAKHLGVVATKFGSEVDNTDYQKELQRISDNILSYEEDIEEAEEEIHEITESLTTANTELRNVRTKIEEILSLGDKSKLLNALKNEESGLRRAEQNQEEALKSLSILVGRNINLSQLMIRDQAKEGMAILNTLSERNQLPKLNIPILQELLERKKCLCEEDLSPGTPKRKFIEESIAASEEADSIQDAATSLYYSVRSQSFDEAPSKWIENYISASKTYINLSTSIKDYQNAIKNINEDISKIDDSNLQAYRDLERSLDFAKSKASQRLNELEFTIKDRTEKKNDAELTRQTLENKIGKVDNVGSYIKLSRKTKDIFENIIEKLKKDELKKVSVQLNKIFLDMIGSDPELNNLTVITKAELTEDFDIVVYGPKGNKLDPDQDLNGASRRAITLAFILALTKVSEVEAPNVIDTPLGMMAGYVKQSVLENTIREGSQLILFLTHDEISGVESLLDKYAGKVYTLTNPAHYPKMLVNRIDVSDSRIVRCGCDHRHVCEKCERISKEA